MSDQVDPIFGLEELRKQRYRLSKGAFYGEGGPARRLPVIQISAQRKGVRLSAVIADDEARTSIRSQLPPDSGRADGTPAKSCDE